MSYPPLVPQDHLPCLAIDTSSSFGCVLLPRGSQLVFFTYAEAGYVCERSSHQTYTLPLPSAGRYCKLCIVAVKFAESPETATLYICCALSGIIFALVELCPLIRIVHVAYSVILNRKSSEYAPFLIVVLQYSMFRRKAFQPGYIPHRHRYVQSSSAL